MEDYVSLFKQQNDSAADDALWGKPALSIIQGLDKNEKIPAIRAIWEMVQNAHDVSISSGAEIEFAFDDDYFYFRHNGIPFTSTSLNSLSLQTSSKVQEDIKLIGQYGTGFMTTNKFGLIFYVSGALRLQKKGEDESLINLDMYINFTEFKIDRSERDKNKLIKILQDQQVKIEKLGEDATAFSINYNKITEFKYEQKHPVERNNVKEAFNAAPNLVPYVLAIIDRVNSISFTGPDKDILSFKRSRENILNLNDNNRKYIFKCIEIERSDRKDRPFKIYIIESLDSIEKESIPKVSVVLPLKEVNGRLTAFQFEKYIPNLFIYLPLIGTEKWGINYIIHSPLFSCTDELRDSVRFASSGQYGDEDSDRNKDIINIASEMIDSFWKDHLSEIADVKYIAEVHFKTNDSNEKIAQYYTELQDSWVKRYKDYVIASVQDGNTTKLVNPSSLWLLDSEMCNEAKENPSFLSAIYSLMVGYKDETTIPVMEDLIYWSEVMNNWDLKDPDNYFIKPEDIAKHIQDLNVTDDLLEAILEFDKYIVKSKQTELFNNYRLIPTEELELKKKDDILKPDSFNRTLRNVMSVLIPEDSSKIVNPLFANLLDDYICFTDNDVNVHIKESVENLKEAQLDINKELKRCRLNNEEDYDYTEGGISDSNVKAMLDYCSMVITQNSTSFDARLLRLVKEFVDYNKIITDTLNENYKYSYILRTLVYDCLYKFTLFEQEKKEEKEEWLSALIRVLFNDDSWKERLKDYMIYPNQIGVYKYSDELQRENNIPPKLKEWYDAVILDEDKKEGQESENETIETICKDLLNNKYADMFIGSKELKGKDLADALYKKIEEDTKWNINNYSYKSIVLSLIELINNKKEWADLFPSLDENKRAQIMLSTVQDPSKSNSIFRFLKFDNKEKMAKLAELGENEDYNEIINVGKISLEQKRAEQRDKEYKNKLGKYVEKFLREQLAENLLKKNVKVNIPDEQGGQDMIISVHDTIIYYIEVKSIWKNTNEVQMTMDQFHKSIEHDKEYALCIVNMEGISHDLVERQEYPPIECMAERIKIYTDIGEKNKELNNYIVKIGRCPTKVNLYGVKVNVPIYNLSEEITLDSFCNLIKTKINNM